MKAFIDTNIFIAVIEGSDGAEAGRELLNKSEWELCTSLLNIVEMRDVLMKKKHKSRETAKELIDWLLNHLDIIVKEAPPLSSINDSHEETLMDPMDCILYEMSTEIDAVFFSLEKELHHHGASHPNEYL